MSDDTLRQQLIARDHQILILQQSVEHEAARVTALEDALTQIEQEMRASIWREGTAFQAEDGLAAKWADTIASLLRSPEETTT